MKFLLYLLYFFRSVFSRGLSGTLRLLVAELRFEKKFGIQTSDIKHSSSPEFFHYQGASYLVLLRLFKQIPGHTKTFDFTDIGCGKGRAVFVAEYCGFNRLSGIELDPELLENARKNAELYVFKRPGSDMRFIHANALNYDYKDQPAVYFLFNPFNESVLRNVLHKIRASTRSETWFIYMNPLYTLPFEEQGAELVKEVKTWRYREAVIYRWAEQK